MAAKNRWEEYQEEKAANQTTEQQGSVKKSQTKKNRWEEYKETHGSNSEYLNAVATSISNRVDTWLRNHNNYIKNYQRRNANRKYSYEDSYVNDSGSWLETINKQKSAFDAEADSILAYMDQYSRYLDADWVKSVKDTLTGARGQQSSILEIATKDNEWWNSFGSEELVKAYGSAEDAYKYYQRADGWNTKYSGMGLTDLQSALNALEDGEEKDWLVYNLTPLAKDTMSKNADWEERSKYQSTYRGGEKFNYLSGMYTDTGFDDIQYDYINRDETAKGRMLVNDVATNASFLGLDTSYLKQMKDDEIAVYNYLYDPNDKTASDEYLKYLLSDLTYRQREKSEEYWAAYAKEHPVASSTFSVLMSPMKGLSAIGQVADYAADGTIDQNAAYNKFSYIPSSIREQVSNDIAKSGKWGEVGSWTYQLGMSMGDFLLNTAVSGGNSTISLALMGSGAMADTVISAKDRGLSDDQAMILGVVAGGAEIITEKFSLDALFNANMTRGTMKYILTNAFTEGTEEVSSSLINLFADILVSKDKSEWQMAINAYLAKNPNASEQQAFMSVLGDTALSLGLDFLGGSLSGGVMGAGGAGVNYVTNAAPYIQQNKDALNKWGDKTDALIQEGLQNDKKSDSYYLANKYQQQTQGKNGKGGKAMTGYQIRQLLAANQEQITANDMQKIQKAAESRLVQKGQKENVTKLAELAAKYVTGQELSRSEKSFLANSKIGAQVTSEMLNAMRGTGSDKLLSKWENDMSEGWDDSYSTEWAESIDTKGVYGEAQAMRRVRAMLDAVVEDPAAYKSLEERVGTEGRFGVSESGQATIRATGKAFDFDNAEVVEVGDGQMSFKREDGGKVSAGGIDFVDANQSFLVSAVSNIENITPAAATSIMHEVVDMSKPMGQQLNGIDEAFTYGYHGYSEADLKAGNFVGNLTNEQMMRAYELGKEARKNSRDSKVDSYKNMRTAAQAEAEKAAATGKAAPKSKKLTITYNHGGGVVEDIETAEKKLGKLHPEQRAGIEAAKILHQMGIGTDFELFTTFYSKTLKDEDGNPLEVFINDQGQEQAAYAGVYMAANGKIRINLNAYSGTKGLTLNALSHELTHFIKTWSLDKYTAMAEFLVKSYGEHGVSMHKLVLKEQDRLERIRGKEVSYDEAYDEVVANAFNRMLEDGKVMDRIAEIRQVDKSLADKIIEGIRKFIKRFFKYYENNQSLFKETEALMEMKEVFEQLQAMFAEALVDASDNFQSYLIAKEAGLEVMSVEDTTQFSYQSLAEAAGFNAVENEDGTRSFVRDGKKVNEVTIADIENSPIGAFINFSVEMKDISEADAKRQKEMFAKICTMACKTNDFAMTMQFVGSAVFTGMKANADKQYGTTYDFPSICTKTQAVIDAMSAKMMSLGRGLNTDEIVKLYDDVFASGNPVPCPECYVFSRWIGIGGLLDNIKKYQDYYGSMAVEDVAAAYLKMKAEVSQFAEEQGISFGKAKGALTSKLTKEYNKLTEKIEKAQNQGEKVKPADQKRLDELEPMMNTVKGMTWLENVYFADSSLKKVNPRFRVPNEVLFDLNNGEAFATQYKEAWAFRTTQGAGYGKAITPYAEARLGEGVLVTNNTTNAIKGKAQGSLDNYFLQQMGKLDKKSRDALKRARLKQKIQAFIGGQRFQSTSDARYENASDYLLAALEMQAMGGMVQVYTKVDGAVPAFSAWGFSINQSLMPLNGGLDADGNVKDTAVGGMKPSVAFENRSKHESAGTITIGVNDNHIRAMFKQLVRDFIIPYHASGGKADTVAEFRRIQEGKEAKGKAVRSTDYSRTQSDKVLSDEVLRWQGKTDAQIQRIHEIRNARIAILTGGNVNMTVVRSNRFLSALYDKLNGGEWDGVKLAKSKVESQIFPNEFWDQTVTYEESAKITKDYLEYCEDLGFLHRFSGMVPSNGKLVPVNGYNENGERVQLTDLAYKYDANGNKTAEVEEFFWKVLTDRRMYDNNGKYLPQKVVTLNDTTTDTVTGFAKNNQGREYDKAKAEALAKKIAGKQYSSQETDLDADKEKVYSYEGLPADAFYNEDYSYIYSYDFLAAQKDMSIVDSLPTLQELQTDGKIDSEKVLDAGYKNILEMGGTKVGDTYSIVNTYTNRPLQIGKSSITHGLGAKDINAKRTNARLAAVIGELCKNAIPICALPNTHNVRGTYAMAVLVNSRVNGKDMNMIALITVEQQNGNVQSVDFVDVAHAVSGRLVRDIEKENRSAQGTPPGTKSEWATRFSSTLKITQFLDIVNRTHQGYLSDDVISKLGEERRGPKKALFSSQETDFDSNGKQLGEDQLEYFENSQVRDRNGNLQVVYHGGTVKFEFDTSRGAAGKTEYGPGAYFTESEFIAKQYSWARGGNVKEYYLNIETMFDDTDMAKTVQLPQWHKLEQILQRNGIAEKYIQQFREYGFGYMRRYLAIKAGDRRSDNWAGSEQLNAMLREAGFDGVKGPVNDSIQYVIFTPNQAKLTTNEVPSTFYDTRYSTQETDLDSHRQMLANAFEGITQNSKEYELIQEYKGRIKILNEYEEKLAKLNAEIRKILFDPDTERDAKKLKELQEEAKKVRENINRNDKKLLSLEASKPLRDVIDRERKKESQKTKAHVKQLIKNKKERAEQTELRHKIRKTVRDLDKILNRGNKQRNVKEDMKGFVSTALDLADYLFTDHISNDDLIRRGIDAELIRGEKEAQLVKETEDILTKLYDEADSLTDEEFTRLDEKRKANEAKLKDLLTAQRNKRLSTPVYNLFNDLVTEYASLKNSKQDAVKAAYNEELENSLRAFISEDDRVKILKNMRVADMTTEELNWLYRAYTMVLNNVRNANKFHVQGMNQSIEQVVGQIAGDFGSRKIPEKKLAIVAQKLANKIGWDYEKLYYALDRIGSDAFTKLIMNLADSENTVMQDIIEAAEFRDEIVKNYGFNNWDVNKKIDKEFMDNTGKKFTMTLGELMSLYAYSRREGAWDHIEYGGFVFGEKALTNPKPADSYKLSKDQCEAITSLLTKEQKGYVEDMQKFLSETMGEKGNEVSMMLYGIKMFGEKNYFPIHIAGQFKAQANESQAKAAAGFQSMSNAGFTHAQNPNAKAPFVLEGFNEVWADHVNEMSRYHGTVPALEDLRRVMNRSTYSDSVSESQSIKQLMENHYGEEAVKYFDNLYREANSGAITDKLQNKSKKLLSLFRKNSVAYSLSVLVQQPASLVRAYAMIDRKYFGFKGFGTITSGVAKAVSSKWNPAYANAYNEMLKYAPGVTMAKQIGGFDTATGGSIRSYLLDTNKSIKQKWKTGTALEKGKAVLDVVDDNAIANLPNVADKIAWIEIWNACKRETVAKHKDLATNSEEFMQIVGERFTEVIRATQVYDSIFAKSPMLKSKNLAVQYLVSFMNEPNTVANMTEKAVRDITKGDWKQGALTGAVVIHSIIFTNMLKSMIYALRDDDEDEAYIEKYIEAITGNMMDDFNPLNYIPIARDAWSIAQGYDVERADMAIVSDAVGALNNVFKNAAKNTEDMTEEELIEFDKKVTETNWQLVESLAAFLGIPVKNIRREINGIIDHAKIASANAGMTNASTVWDTISEAVIDSIPFMSNKETKNDKLYDAIVSGDTAYVGRLKSTYKDDAAYNSAVRKALRENDSRIHDAAQARYDGNMDEYKRIFREIQGEGNFTFDEIMDAVNAEENAIKNKIEPEKVTSSYSTSDFVQAVSMGDTNTASAAMDDIIATHVANGKTQAEAEAAFVSSVKTSTHDAYSSGLLDEAGAKNMLMEYADMDEEEAASRVNYWTFCEENPQYDYFSESNVNKYQEFAEPAEIPLEVFAQYVEGTKGLTEIKDEWGDVEVTKREQVLEVIDSLPLTWEQKDALYLAHGYAESKIWDVPW